jgi:hypothetical protein
MRGFVTGDSPKMNDIHLTNDLISHLDELEKAHFKLFQAVGLNGYNQVTGGEILDREDMALDVKGLVKAVIEYTALVSKTQQAYSNELDSAVELAKTAKHIVKDTAYTAAINAAVLTTTEAKKKRTKAEKSENKRNNAVSEAKKSKHIHLTTLFTKYLKKYANDFPSKLSKNIHLSGVYTATQEQVYNNLVNDKFEVYFKRTNTNRQPATITYRRHYKKALALLGYPQKPR